MSFWNISSDSEVNNASGIKNDFGTVRGGGNIGSIERFAADPVSLGLNTKIDVAYGNGIVKSIPGGVANTINQVVRRVTRSIAGESNDALYSGGSNAANRQNSSINQIGASYTSSYKSSVQNGDWKEYSGVFNPVFSVGNSGLWNPTVGSDMSDVVIASGIDKAANPTRQEPGRLIFSDGSAKPKQQSYKGVSVKNPIIPRVNLLTDPTDFTSASWIKNNVTAAGDTFFETAVSAAYQIRQDIPVTSGSTYEWSVEAKTVGAQFLGIYFDGITWTLDSPGIRWIDLTTGFKQPAIIDRDFTVIAGDDGWHRMIRTAEAASSGTGQFYLIFGIGEIFAPTTTYAGNPTDGIRIRNAYVFNNDNL